MDVLILGLGNIAKSFLVVAHLTKLPIKKIYIIDKKNYRKICDEILSQTNFDYEFHHIKITPSNLKEIREQFFTKVNMVIDCSYNIDTLDLLKNLEPNTCYINTSVEFWEEEDNTSKISSLKERQDEIKKWYKEKKRNLTILLDCGMNPGLISLWAYQAIEKYNIDPEKVEKCIISEYDSQISKRFYSIHHSSSLSNRSIPKGQFINTWSPYGYLEEVHSPLEGRSRGEYYLNNYYTGFEMKSYSLRPSLEPFVGFTVRHSEAITLKSFFPNATLMFIYRSCPESILSLRGEYKIVKPIAKEISIHSPDIESGQDELGVWISDGESLIWYGSVLSNDDVKNIKGIKNLYKYINATSYQVAKGLYVGFKTLEYCLEHKIHALMFPEDIISFDFEEWLEEANSDLKIISKKFKVGKKTIVDNFINMKTFEDHFIL